jgi:MFS family permease
MTIKSRLAAFGRTMRTPSERAVVTAVFFAFAIGLGLWAGAIPALLRQSGVSAAGLGIAISLHSGAYIGAMALGGQLARVVAPRRLIVAALALNTLTFAALFTAASPLALTLALTAVGLSAGLLDLAMNTEATAVERDLGRPVLLRIHAAASGAFGLGAIAGSLIAVGLGPRWCAAVVVALALPVALAVRRLGPRRQILLTVVAAPARKGATSGIAILGIVLGFSIGAEMAAQMWSATFLEGQAADLAAIAGIGAAFFAACQVVVRVVGDRLRRRFGDERVIESSLLLAAVGFTTVALSKVFAISVAGFALVGLGTACVVPCCFALVARRSPGRTAAALGIASLVAGLIRLPTPLYLGFVAATWSDAAAFGGIALALLLTAALAKLGISGRTG